MDIPYSESCALRFPTHSALALLLRRLGSPSSHAHLSLPPLSPSVHFQASFLAALALLLASLWLLLRLGRKEEWTSLGADAWDVVSVAVQQSGPGLAVSRRAPFNTAMLAFIVFSFLAAQVYSARLTAEFARNRRVPPFEDEAGLAALVMAGKAEWVMPSFWVKGKVWRLVSNIVSCFSNLLEEEY